ncbi:PREDICTED: gamma-glutamyltransferase 5 [Nanorana parkeri]|uniref:gamma-glutamyltransferase 5 n=1 Tax=Nanorana parkeri TaxID=125878 RepID=UPI0008546835|nr:PREDICTED: gamma-glutamyltransferase 5 [Nanorana parkeri]
MTVSPGWVSLMILMLFVLAGIIIPLALVMSREKLSCDHGAFFHGAVAADSEICSDIGRDILKQGGSPVDSAIAALICTTVIHPQSMGLGGGVIFTIYNASTGEKEVINARETVPSRSPPNLTKQCFSPGFVKPGVQWIGVPGELRGYEAAHRRHGRLPWKSLFEPTIKLVTNGIQVSSLVSKYLAFFEKLIKKHSICQLLCENEEVLKEGQAINFTQLGRTLQVLADEGVESFYNGSISKKLLEDLNNEGSFLTEDDLQNYKVQIVRPLNFSLGSHTLYSPPPPAGGAILSFLLNVLEGYHFSPSSVQSEQEQIQTYHYVTEAFKFANGQKCQLAEGMAAGNTKELVDSLLSPRFAQMIREKIDDSGDHTLSFYNVSSTHPETMGTTHISVITKDGSSVSVTSSINHVFGAMIYSPSTGIILNNQLADFCITPPSQPIMAGQQPPSSMTPAILLSHDKKSQLVIGGAGGVRIISATTQALINKLWFGYNLEKAISLPVFHVTARNHLDFEKDFSKAVQQGLHERGHTFENFSFALNVVQGVSQEDGCLFAFSDTRKEAKAAGY